MPVVNKEIKLADAAKVCPYGKRSIERWVAVYKKGGENALEPKSTSPKTNPVETPIWIKEKVIRRRKNTKLCATHDVVHYLIDPGKPAQNGKVEQSHRTDQEQFYDQYIFKNVYDLKKKIRVWNTKYNNIMHCGLKGKSPNQFLVEYQLTNPPNVLA